nr:MAG TPA: hypothetical protein [Bacteriophage sp.]
MARVANIISRKCATTIIFIGIFNQHHNTIIIRSCYPELLYQSLK